MRPWVTLFSQTGSDIYNVSKALKKAPDVIITNKLIEDIDTINQNLLDEYFDRIIFLPRNKPTIEEYLTAIPDDSLVTLHGWLRIVPPEICDRFEIYNLHPAPLSKYEFLKGKDPQIRTFEMKLEYSGNTIHKCIPELDAGEILAENSFSVKGYTLDQIFEETHREASNLWCKFLKERL